MSTYTRLSKQGFYRDLGILVLMDICFTLLPDWENFIVRWLHFSRMTGHHRWMLRRFTRKPAIFPAVSDLLLIFLLNDLRGRPIGTCAYAGK